VVLAATLHGQDEGALAGVDRLTVARVFVIQNGHVVERVCHGEGLGRLAQFDFERLGVERERLCGRICRV